MTAWFAELAWTGDPESGVEAGVLIETSGERIMSVTPGAPFPPRGAQRLAGLTVPGLVNAHSHAFHRALRGRTHLAGAGDFWGWRQLMYEVAASLDPDTYFELARACYAEMALSGITAVGEFHYVHHQADGAPYADANQMGRGLIAAAREAGIRITLLDTCYLRSGFVTSELDPVQVRFCDVDAGRWALRVAGLSDAKGPTCHVGAAIHSVRAVPGPAITAVAAWAADEDAPLHVHVSEQPGENRDCLAATGLTPTAVLAAAGALGPRSTAVHATHASAADIEALGSSGTAVCLCPTTERDLADGIGPAGLLVGAGAVLCLGSDSQAQIDLFEEARAVELDERLSTGRRGNLDPSSLLAAAAAGGAASLGWDAGRLEPGRLADFITIDLQHSVRLAGAACDPAAAVAHVVFAAAAGDVAQVVVGGRLIVENGRHLRVPDVPAALAAALAALPRRARRD